MRKMLYAAVALGLSVATAPGYAAAYNFTISGPAPNLGGLSFSGSGTLTTGAASGGGTLITSISGEIGGVAINALLAPGGFEDNDDLFFPNAPTATSLLDTAGVAFTDVDGGKFDVFSFFTPGSVIPPASVNPYGEITTAGAFGVGTFAVTPAPEPASLSLLCVAAVCMGAIRKRRA
jgi:hypothetical protein